jgi:AraC-like DNA-binding protein
MIVAAAQGLLLAVLIFQKHRALSANRYLASLMLCYTIILVHLLLQDVGFYTIAPWVFLIVGVPLLAMPLHYLYTKHLINRSPRLELREWLHLAPFFVFETGLVVIVIWTGLDMGRAASAQPGDAPWTLRLFNWVIIAQGSVYLGISVQMINRYNKHIKDVLSSIERVHLAWLRNVSIAGLTAIGCFFIEDVLMTRGINISNFILSSVGFAIYVYGIGYTGLSRSEIFTSPEAERSLHIVADIETEEQAAAQTTRYENPRLSPEITKDYLDRLLALMDEKKPYLDSGLTLPQLAKLLSITPHQLSEVINTQLQKNFFEFINSYRIEHVKEDLLDPAKNHLKLLAIAFDAGFNSKPTFNTIFKAQTKMTPSEYRKQQ